jgi:chloramphenicol-sensitive protein RarD
VVPHAQATDRTGLRLGAAAYGLWGLFPLYFHQLSDIEPIQVLAHRIWWSVVVLAIVQAVRRTRASSTGDHPDPAPATAATPKQKRLAAVAGVLLASNWLIYVWAVSVDRVVEASLGYYLTPLLTVALGVGVLHEKLRPAHRVVLCLAAAGVAVLTVAAGTVPWVSLGLATTFSLYSLLKKQVALDTFQSLWFETAPLAPLAAAALLVWAAKGTLSLGDPLTTVLLVSAGVVTAVPLLLFAAAGRRLPLVWIGLLQYLTPTLQFGLATLVYHEAVSAQRLIGFVLVWAAVVVMCVDAARSLRGPVANSAVPPLASVTPGP